MLNKLLTFDEKMNIYNSELEYHKNNFLGSIINKKSGLYLI